MTMEWLLIAVTTILLLMNVKLMLSLKKQQPLDEDPTGIHDSMEAFVNQLEKENDELYDKLIAYIKDSEQKLMERVDHLEQNGSAAIEKTEIGEKNPVETGKVLQLSKQGFSSKQIAKVLQMDFGKVELIVNMQNKQQGNYN